MLSELQAGRLQREEANGYINPHKNSHSFAALGTIYKLVKAQVNPGGNTIVLPIGPCCERYNLPETVLVTTPKRECVVKIDYMRIFFEKVIINDFINEF